MPMNPQRPRFAMVAGEASGDLLAGLLLGGLQARWPRAAAPPASAARAWPRRASTPGGRTTSSRCAAMSRCCATTARSPASATSSRERLLRRHARRLHRRRCARLQPRPRGQAARRAASRRSISSARRSGPGAASAIEKIARAADHVLCIFPFEPEIYAQRTASPPAYVGHPLADAIPLRCRAPPARAALGLGDDDTVVALLPGSRRSEIQYIAPRLLGAAAADAPGAARRCASCCRSSPGLRDAGRAAAPRARARRADRRCSTASSHDALAACDVTLIASGTATLEAALFKRPMVIAYAMHVAQLADDEAHAATSPGSACPTSCCATSWCPSCCRATRRREASPRRPSRWLDDPRRCDALRRALRRAAPARCGATPRTLATDAIETGPRRR